ncbi:hypothetical protein QFZ57_002366 [Arthrobacter sp. B1I2]|nr:hypothetical protein [Arthrobacter sp. B1I2]
MAGTAVPAISLFCFVRCYLVSEFVEVGFVQT